MIASIDLRIGNWIEIEGKGFTQIKKASEIDHVGEESFKPIPITEELLLALSFTKRAASELYEIKQNNFAYHIAFHRVCIFHPGNLFWHWLGSHIDYVHQLQNLFYCIVGYDLTIKEEVPL